VRKPEARRRIPVGHTKFDEDIAPRLARYAELTKAIVGVGKPGQGGRGFVVEIGRQRLIITAAHCLPALPPAHPGSYLEELTYQALLGPLGATPTVWAECLFADPVADIAVLGAPDNQELSAEADAYEAMVADVTPLVIADAPKRRRKRVQLPYGGRFGGPFWVDTPGRCSARLLSLDGKWLDCTVTRHPLALSIDQLELVVGGMSGSPIVTTDGRAIGVISTERINPILTECLPGRFLQDRRRPRQQGNRHRGRDMSKPRVTERNPGRLCKLVDTL